jgi:hypothetical protein
VERIGAAYLWGLEPLDGACIRQLFETAGAEDLIVLSRVFWMVRNNNPTPDQRERILVFWEQCVVWAQHQKEVPASLLSSLSLLATHVTTIGPREQTLLRTVAPHVHKGHGTYEFVAELLRLAPQDPPTVTETFRSMIEAHPPEYDFQDRIRSLLQILSERGQKDKVILMADRLRQLDGIHALFRELTSP